MENEILKDKYEIMEERLRDDAKSLKSIRELAREMIKRIKMINEEINIINPDRVLWNKLSENNKDKIAGLYQLRETYISQLDVIYVILNKSNVLISKFKKEQLQNKGIENEFFINIKE